MTSLGLSRSAEDVLRRLQRTFRQGPMEPAARREALECLQELADPGLVSGFLQGHRKTGLAIGHENGFLKFTLYDAPDAAFRLRLHVWLAGREEISPDIHNHTRDYWSVVLAGSLRIEEFAPSSDGETYHEYLASNRNTNRRYTFSHRGSTRMVCVGVEDVRSGDSHSAPHAIFHRVSVLSYPACTLFLQGPEQCSDTLVFSNQRKRFGESEVVRPSPEAIACALAAVGL